MALPPDALLRTPLTDLHRRLGARLVPFAGYEMPVQYPAGIMKEHLHTRAAAGLFDVSHMGQIRISGPEAAARLESLVVGDMKGIAPGRQRYTLFTNAQGGILDDLMVANFGDHLLLVVNAGTKHDDLAHLRANLAGLTVEPLFDRALIALQGPAAAAVLSRHLPEVATMPFMAIAAATLFGVPVTVSRSGYTGEDGYEIGIPGEAGEMVAERLLAEPEVEAIGLGARDSLRLEAGLCLYGHDIDTTTTPVEAGLTWAMPKRRREEGGFPGAEVVRAQLAEGPRRKRVGLKLDGRQPAREGAEIADSAGAVVGRLTSGGFGPSAEAPIAMGYVDAAHAAPGTALQIMVRGKALAATVVPMPFVAQRYYRG